MTIYIELDDDMSNESFVSYNGIRHIDLYHDSLSFFFFSLLYRMYIYIYYFAFTMHYYLFAKRN